MRWLVLAVAVLPLAACDGRGTLNQQPGWNGVGMPGMGPGFGGPGFGAAERRGPDGRTDAEVQRDIRRGEDVENEEARRAGIGPSPTDGMNCRTTTTSSGGSNRMNSTTTTTCN